MDLQLRPYRLLLIYLFNLFGSLSFNVEIENDYCGWANDNRGENGQPKMVWQLEKGSNGASTNTGPGFGWSFSFKRSFHPFFTASIKQITRPTRQTEFTCSLSKCLDFISFVHLNLN
jgi:hypothetical protein